MHKNLILILIIIAIFLTGCEPYTGNDDASAGNRQDGARELSYTQDLRTGLCFATYQSSHNFREFTTVPCTDKVMELVKR